MQYQTPGDTRVGIIAAPDGVAHFFRPTPGYPLFWSQLCRINIIEEFKQDMVTGFAFDENGLSFAGKPEPDILKNTCDRCREVYKALWKPEW